MLSKNMFFSKESLDFIKSLNKKDAQFVLLKLEHWKKEYEKNEDKQNTNYVRINKNFRSTIIIEKDNLVVLEIFDKQKMNSGVNFEGASFEKATLISSYFIKANFDNTILKEAKLNSAMLINCTFRKANLQNADFSFSFCEGSDFSGSNADNASFEATYLVDAVFKNANLSNSNLSRSNMRGVSLENCNLSGAKMGQIENFKEIKSFINCNISGIIDLEDENKEFAIIKGARFL